jgi:hypothetical protein
MISYFPQWNKTIPSSWKRGVKQGYPLNYRLFNLCLEPFIQLIKTAKKDREAFVRINENILTDNLVRVNADDVAII